MNSSCRAIDSAVVVLVKYISHLTGMPLSDTAYCVPTMNSPKSRSAPYKVQLILSMLTFPLFGRWVGHARSGMLVAFSQTSH